MSAGPFASLVAQFASPVDGAVAWIGAGLFVIGVILVVYAVRHRREASRAAAEAAGMLREADAIKNDFVTMVSHEFRTPLASISGFAEILQTWRELPDEEVDEFLGLVKLESDKLASLIEDVLVIPRLEAGRLKLDQRVFALSPILHQLSSLVFPTAGDKQVAISVPGGIEVYGDERRVEQVLRNLFENAKVYGGDQVLVEGYALPEHFVVVVSDNGRGVPDSAVDSIFQSFEQVSKGDARLSSGIGLGLPIARRLARAMGGDVWFESRFPTGSRFCFSITQSRDVAEAILAEREHADA